jgi:plasmid stability protein
MSFCNWEKPMPNLTVRNIPDSVYATLQSDARRNRRSLNAEILAILADKAEMARRRARAAEAMKRLDILQAELARDYPNQPASADLIREDRDSR